MAAICSSLSCFFFALLVFLLKLAQTATTQLRLALEAEDERSAKKLRGLDLDLIWI